MKPTSPMGLQTGGSRTGEATKASGGGSTPPQQVQQVQHVKPTAPCLPAPLPKLADGYFFHEADDREPSDSDALRRSHSPTPGGTTPGARATSRQDPAPWPSVAGLRVLVVDDEDDARDLLISVFEQWNAEVRGVCCALDAFEELRRAPPDVIVSDIGMPGEDGYSLIRRVRALPSTLGGRTPAVALTAFARTEDRALALRAGFDLHVTKPVEPAELVAVVATLAATPREPSE